MVIETCSLLLIYFTDDDDERMNFNVA